LKVFLQKHYDDIRLQSSGGVQPNLNLSIIKRTVVPFPPLNEQRRIVDEVERRISVVENLESSIGHQLVRAEQARQAILKVGFEGRLVSQEPADEPASALLERVKADRQTGPHVSRGRTSRDGRQLSLALS